MIRATARFTSDTVLAMDDGSTVAAKAIVIATGSKPKIHETFATVDGCLLTNETVFELADLPRRLGVIGAGPLGLELAQAFSRLGVEVAVFDQGKRFAGLSDPAVSSALLDILGRDFPVRLGVNVAARPDGAGARLSWSGPEKGEASFDRMLVATGRPPHLKGLGLETTGVKLDDHGTPHFDRDTMQCEGTPIFLAGDADGERAVLHEASAEGAIAGANAASFPHVEPGKRTAPFSIMFTDPPLAVVG